MFDRVHFERSLVVIGLILSSLLTFTGPAGAQTPGQQSKVPTALVYKGPGSCPEDCSKAAAEMARMAGMNPVYVGPDETRAEIFNDAVVWIQPGGKSSEVSKTMNAILKQLIREFVFRGGG